MSYATYQALLNDIEASLLNKSINGSYNINYVNYQFEFPADIAATNFPALLIVEGLRQFQTKARQQTMALNFFGYFRSDKSGHLDLRTDFENAIIDELLDQTNTFSYFLEVQAVEYTRIFNLFGWNVPLFPPYYGFRIDTELLTERIGA